MKAKFLGFDGARHAPALFAACILAALSAPAPAHAGDPRGCGPVKDADFTMTTLVSQTAGNLQEPLRMAFDMSEKGDVDIYFVEKAGKVRKYDGATKQVSTLGSISVRTTGEHGLLGIALDHHHAGSDAEACGRIALAAVREMGLRGFGEIHRTGINPGRIAPGGYSPCKGGKAPPRRPRVVA